ncbi:MAG TPA: response regulator transcription factor [Gammaproteobacteria bacterium]|nr:response regulator transcription factor [Gammaproteobacteria bacterium]
MSAPGSDLELEAPSLLLVDDDPVFCRVLARALGRRGFAVQYVHSVSEARAWVAGSPPEYAVLDLDLPGESGLVLLQELLNADAHTRVVVLTGYASVATAVEAIKLGAVHYLPKPADADEVVAAFSRAEGDASVKIATRPLSVNRMEWEHLQKVLRDHHGNISATARALGMHRRTLQRKLRKKPRAE